MSRLVRCNRHGLAAALAEPEVLTALDAVVKLYFRFWHKPRLINQEETATVQVAKLLIA